MLQRNRRRLIIILRPEEEEKSLLREWPAGLSWLAACVQNWTKPEERIK